MTVIISLKKKSFLIIMLQIVLLGVFCECEISQSQILQKVKIVCIGDSITQGGKIGREEFSYRLPLFNMLRKNNIDVDFIGAHNKGLDELFLWPKEFDADHEGFYGATTEYVDKALKEDLPRIDPPDFALIHLGSNDGEKDPQKAVIPYLKDIIVQLRTRNPSIIILIGQCPGIWKNLCMHIDVWLMARKFSTMGSPIQTVPLYLNWSMKKDTFDGSHPNLAGQEKIARRFYKAMKPEMDIKFGLTLPQN